MPVPNELRAETMTEVVNVIEPQNSFLTTALYPRSVERTLGTPFVRIDTATRLRQAAPFVMPHGEGVTIQRRSAGGHTYETPNIRLKMPLTPSDILMTRKPGQAVFVDAASSILRDNTNAQIAEDMADMVAAKDETVEWMVAQSLQGAIAYEVEDKDSFEIDFGRSPNNNVTLTHFWDDFYPDDPTPLSDIYTIKKILADAGEPSPTDVIYGDAATQAVMYLLERLKIPAMNTQSGVDAGQATLQANFQANGAIYLGYWGGLRHWGYTRTTRFSDSSSSAPLIRSKYAEFVNLTPAADRVMYYGAIPDMTAIRSNRFRNRVFSKSWEIEDPSGYMALIHSRPLPVPRRPNASVSVQVVE